MFLGATQEMSVRKHRLKADLKTEFNVGETGLVTLYSHVAFSEGLTFYFFSNEKLRRKILVEKK